jgi:hypothetical protein
MELDIEVEKISTIEAFVVSALIFFDCVASPINRFKLIPLLANNPILTLITSTLKALHISLTIKFLKEDEKPLFGSTEDGVVGDSEPIRKRILGNDNTGCVNMGGGEEEEDLNEETEEILC